MVGVIIGANIHRRHMDESQRAMVAARIANMRQGERTDIEPSALMPKVSVGQAAKSMQVGERTVTQARTILRESPDLADAVLRGEKTVHGALKEIKETETQTTGSSRVSGRAWDSVDGLLPVGNISVISAA